MSEKQLSTEEVARQTLLSTLAKSELKDIKELWQGDINRVEYDMLRPAKTGMVMAVARAGSTGEPFNLGEVSVTRCAIRVKSGETGIAYVRGSSKEHALHIAVLDALAQTPSEHEAIHKQVIAPLQQKLKEKSAKQQQHAAKTKVDFFTLARGED